MVQSKLAQSCFRNSLGLVARPQEIIFEAYGQPLTIAAVWAEQYAGRASRGGAELRPTEAWSCRVNSMRAGDLRLQLDWQRCSRRCHTTREVISHHLEVKLLDIMLEQGNPGTASWPYAKIL